MAKKGYKTRTKQSKINVNMKVGKKHYNKVPKTRQHKII